MSALPFSASDTGPKMLREMLERTVALKPLIPHVPSLRQILLLELEYLDAFYGGAAKAGKAHDRGGKGKQK
jgi:hypothetical protein